MLRFCGRFFSAKFQFRYLRNGLFDLLDLQINRFSDIDIGSLPEKKTEKNVWQSLHTDFLKTISFLTISQVNDFLPVRSYQKNLLCPLNTLIDQIVLARTNSR